MACYTQYTYIDILKCYASGRKKQTKNYLNVFATVYQESSQVLAGDTSSANADLDVAIRSSGSTATEEETIALEEDDDVEEGGSNEPDTIYEEVNSTSNASAGSSSCFQLKFANEIKLCEVAAAAGGQPQNDGGEENPAFTTFNDTPM